MTCDELAVSARNVSKSYALGLSGRTTSVREMAQTFAKNPLKFRWRKRDRLHALSDVSFEVDRGEVVGIIGRNGAGKSTLLKVLSRITYPEAGEIDLYGRTGSLLEVGTGFHPELTGLENVYLNGLILGMKTREIDRKLDDIVAFSEVEAFLGTPVKRYSSGMRVRLAFSVAAHLDPEILIVDEVLAVGDANFQRRCLAKMKELASNEGRTVLFVSHNLVAVEHLCPRTIYLEQGKVAYDGPTRDSVRRYLGATDAGPREDSPGVFDLTDRLPMEEATELVLRRLQVEDGRGIPTESVGMGQDLHLCLDVSGLSRYPAATLVIGIASESDGLAFRVSSLMKPLSFRSRRCEHETVRLVIPNLPLTPGRYVVDLLVDSEGRRPIDRIRPAGEFIVEPIDTYGTGYRATANDGMVLTDFSWDVVPTDARAEAG